MSTGEFKLVLVRLIVQLKTSPHSFAFRKSTALYNRRQAKILSTLTSLFTSSYVLNWQRYFPETPLQYAPSFDGRIILYPSAKEMRDYFSWRQADSKHYDPSRETESRAN